MRLVVAYLRRCRLFVRSSSVRLSFIIDLKSPPPLSLKCIWPQGWSTSDRQPTINGPHHQMTTQPNNLTASNNLQTTSQLKDPPTDRQKYLTTQTTERPTTNHQITSQSKELTTSFVTFHPCKLRKWNAFDGSNLFIENHQQQCWKHNTQYSTTIS